MDEDAYATVAINVGTQYRRVNTDMENSAFYWRNNLKSRFPGGYRTVARELGSVRTGQQVESAGDSEG